MFFELYNWCNQIKSVDHKKHDTESRKKRREKRKKSRNFHQIWRFGPKFYTFHIGASNSKDPDTIRPAHLTRVKNPLHLWKSQATRKSELKRNQLIENRDTLRSSKMLNSSSLSHTMGGIGPCCSTLPSRRWIFFPSFISPSIQIRLFLSFFLYNLRSIWPQIQLFLSFFFTFSVPFGLLKPCFEILLTSFFICSSHSDFWVFSVCVALVYLFGENGKTLQLYGSFQTATLFK